MWILFLPQNETEKLPCMPVSNIKYFSTQKFCTKCINIKSDTHILSPTCSMMPARLFESPFQLPGWAPVSVLPKGVLHTAGQSRETLFCVPCLRDGILKRSFMTSCEIALEQSEWGRLDAYRALKGHFGSRSNRLRVLLGKGEELRSRRFHVFNSCTGMTPTLPKDGKQSVMSPWLCLLQQVLALSASLPLSHTPLKHSVLLGEKLFLRVLYS